ncbi:MAG: ABC transporter permease [Chloroflexota bacterium]|nr:ABC transporter permease [Chloroflexota bacterium]
MIAARIRAAGSLARLHPAGAVGAIVLLVIAFGAVFAPMLAIESPEKQQIAISLQAPSVAHPFGTDDLGRDVWSRLLYGGQVSLGVGFVSTILATVVGVVGGLISGYAGKWVDGAIMRATDVLLAFPTLILAVAIVGVLGPDLVNATIAIAIATLPRFTRIIRAETIRLRAAEFVEAAVSVGVPGRRIMFRHILPNTAGLIVVQFALSVAASILSEASLSFLGLGVRPPTPSWGSMLRAGYPFLALAPWISIASGLAVSVTVLASTLVGDAIRDHLDPRLRH